MGIILHILILLLSSIAIYFLGARFATASSRIGDYLNMSRAIKGATFDAIASSLPELMVALFAVVFFNSFEVGIGTIAGSALFNLLVIPGLSVLAAPVAFKVTERVVTRDALFYVISVFILVVLTFYAKMWGVGIALFLLAVYVHYVDVIRRDNKVEEGVMSEEERGKVDIKKEVLVTIGLVVGIGVATFFLTESSMEFAHILGVSPVIIAFVLTAAATSVPDTVISVVNARKGQTEDAASNVFGSNTFDICVALGLPLLVYALGNGPVAIEFGYIEILFGLLGATIIVLYLLAQNRILSKKEGVFLLFMYLVFIAYVVLVSTGAIAAVV